MKRAAVVFAREPEVGKVKTRLAQSIGASKACEAYRLMLVYTLEILQSSDAPVIVYLTPESKTDFLREKSFPKGFHVRKQVEADLGEKMHSMFDDMFAEGHDQVVLVGSDCPALSVGHIQRAFTNLNKYDCVFGPAVDGGYYLVGQSACSRNVFEGISWSTETVMQETRELLARQGWSYGELDKLSDVDYIEDLRLFFASHESIPQTLKAIEELIV